MQFLVKDLLISVFPSRLSMPRGCEENATCTPVTGRCPGCSETGTKDVVELFTPVINPASPLALSALKHQLREVLAAVEAKEKVVQESLQPQTLEEAEFLQSYLTAAIEELKERSKALTKRGER